VTYRTTRAEVCFYSPFRLPSFADPQPAGQYRVEFDEEPIECNGVAWRRRDGYIFLPAIGVASATESMVPISPADLDQLIEKDHENS